MRRLKPDIGKGLQFDDQGNLVGILGQARFPRLTLVEFVHQTHAHQAQGIDTGFQPGHDPGDKQGAEGMLGNGFPAGTQEVKTGPGCPF